MDLIIGAAGGTKITTSVAQVMLLILKYNYNLKASMDRRRLHHQVTTIDNLKVVAHVHEFTVSF